MTLDCYICHARFADNNQFATHLRKAHGLGSQAYYDAYVKKDGEGKCAICGKPTKYNGLARGYAEYCSSECQLKGCKSRIGTGGGDKETSLRCEICGETVTAKNKTHASIALSSHLKKVHNIYSMKAYYDNFVRKEGEGICPACGRETNFQGIFEGYTKYCNAACMNVDQRGKENNQYNARLKAAAKIREGLKEIAEKVVQKYRDFLRGDKRISMFDTRGNDRIEVNTVSDDKSVETVDGDTVTVKTEVSCSTARAPETGTQTRYTPRYERCEAEYVFDDIIDDGRELNRSEWCS